MKTNKTLRNIVLTGALALGGISCVRPPELKRVADLTGDGIDDILVNEFGVILNASVERNYLFIGQKDGSFIRTKEEDMGKGVKYFKTDDGTVYFFDGKIYRE